MNPIRPNPRCARYLQETSAGQWETILLDAEADLSPLDRPEDYTAWLTEVYAGLPEEYTLVRTSGGEGQTYALMDGSREVSRLILTPAPAESGRSWQVRTLADPLPPVEILAPEGCTVQVNGTPLGSEYRTGSQAAVGYDRCPRATRRPRRKPSRIRRAADGTGDHRCHSQRHGPVRWLLPPRGKCAPFR